MKKQSSYMGKMGYEGKKMPSKSEHSPKGMGASQMLKDNKQASSVMSIPTTAPQKERAKKIHPYSCGDKGYPSEAFKY